MKKIMKTVCVAISMIFLIACSTNSTDKKEEIVQPPTTTDTNEIGKTLEKIQSNTSYRAEEVLVITSDNLIDHQVLDINNDEFLIQAFDNQQDPIMYQTSSIYKVKLDGTREEMENFQMNGGRLTSAIFDGEDYIYSVVNQNQKNDGCYDSKVIYGDEIVDTGIVCDIFTPPYLEEFNEAYYYIYNSFNEDYTELTRSVKKIPKFSREIEILHEVKAVVKEFNVGSKYERFPYVINSKSDKYIAFVGNEETLNQTNIYYTNGDDWNKVSVDGIYSIAQPLDDYILLANVSSPGAAIFNIEEQKITKKLPGNFDRTKYLFNNSIIFMGKDRESGVLNIDDDSYSIDKIEGIKRLEGMPYESTLYEVEDDRVFVISSFNSMVDEDKLEIIIYELFKNDK